jgi:hypothetical protein
MDPTFVARSNTSAIDWSMAVLGGIVAMVVFVALQIIFALTLRETGPLQPLVTFGTATLRAVAPSAAAGGGSKAAGVGVALLLALGALSGIVLALLVHRTGTIVAIVVGAVFGIVVYAIDMYGFARFFPVLVGLRDWPSALAYVVQGALAAGLYKAMTRNAVLIIEDSGHDLRKLRDVRLV